MTRLSPARVLALGLLALALSAPFPAPAQQAPAPAPGATPPGQSQAPAKALPPAERRAMEEIIRDYILKNPDVIIDSIQKMRDREERAARDRARANLVKLRAELADPAAAPQGGNPEGDVAIVEFFDYRCQYCKRVFPDLMKALEQDGNVRLVFREFPILGPESLVAARAALAAWMTEKEKYQPFHRALMGARGGLSEARVLGIAAGAGLDAGKLREAMRDPRIEGMIERNYQLAEALEIQGTPAFVIGEHVIRGAIDLKSLRQLIAAARGS